MSEGDAEAVVAEGPVEGVGGRGAEAVEEGDVGAERGEEGRWDGREADVFESTAVEEGG